MTRHVFVGLLERTMVFVWLLNFYFMCPFDGWGIGERTYLASMRSYHTYPATNIIGRLHFINFLPPRMFCFEQRFSSLVSSAYACPLRPSAPIWLWDELCFCRSLYRWWILCLLVFLATMGILGFICSWLRLPSSFFYEFESYGFRAEIPSFLESKI